MSNFFDTRIEYLKGVGPQKAALLNTELHIFTYGDLIQHYPFRHEDRTKVYAISEINESMSLVQIKGQIYQFETVGEGFKSRLVAYFTDGDEEMELVWFGNTTWIAKNLKKNTDYLIFGKPQFFNGKVSIPHPEMELFEAEQASTGFLQPVYSITEKLRKNL
jgi:ATP-dependent DNA helicase RecG